MSAPYLEIVLKKVRLLEGEQRAYYERIVTSIESVPAFEQTQNVAFMLLAHGLEDLPEPVPHALSEKAFLTHLSRYIRTNQGIISREMYSERFARSPAKVAREISQGFAAQVAQELLEQYAEGTLELGEPKTVSFRWPYYEADDAFPYEDGEEG